MSLPAERIRPIAICVFRQGDRILVASAYDPVKQQRFCRPLGGGVEFGERAVDALRREIREELHAEIAEPRLLGVLENIFVHQGRAGHEIVFVFQARLAEAALARQAELPIYEPGWEGPAQWLDLNQFDERTPLYPAGLRELLG